MVLVTAHITSFLSELTFFWPFEKEIGHKVGLSTGKQFQSWLSFKPWVYLRKRVSVTGRIWIEWTFQLSFNVQIFNIIQWFPIALWIKFKALPNQVLTYLPVPLYLPCHFSQVFLFLGYTKFGPTPEPLNLLFPLLKLCSPPSFHAYFLFNIQISAQI